MPRKKKEIVINREDALVALKEKLGNDPELLKLIGALTSAPPKAKKPATKKPKKSKKVEVVEEIEPEVQDDEPEFDSRGTRFKSSDEPNKRAVKFRPLAKPSGPNLFKDDGKQCRDAEDERLKALNVVVKSERKTFSKVKVRCSNDGCNRSEVVHPMYNTEFFKCSKCTTNRR